LTWKNSITPQADFLPAFFVRELLFFTSQRQYPLLVAPMYDTYLPAGCVFMSVAVTAGVLAAFIKKKAETGR